MLVTRLQNSAYFASANGVAARALSWRGWVRGRSARGGQQIDDAPGRIALPNLVLVVVLHALPILLIWQMPAVTPVKILPQVLRVTLLQTAPSAQPVEPPRAPATAPVRAQPDVRPLVRPAPREAAPLAVTQPAAEAPNQVAPSPAQSSATQMPATAGAASSMASASQPRFDADYLDNPKPPFPAIARRLGEQGRVMLRVRVDAGGQALDVQLHASSGSPRLDQSALETVRRWKFVPARLGNEPVAATVLVPIAFSLKD